MKATLITSPGDKSILFSAYYGIGALARMSENVKTTPNFSSKTCSGRKTQGVTVFKTRSVFYQCFVVVAVVVFASVVYACYRHCPCLDYPSHQAVGR